MKTTINFYVTTGLQKKFLAEGKNAEEKQLIELDLNNQELIEKANIDSKGNAYINIDSYRYHYDSEGNWNSQNTRFSVIPDENDLVLFFQNEKNKNENDKIITEKDNKTREIQEIEKEKIEKEKRIENEKREAEKKIEDEENQKIIDDFVNDYGTEKLKLRKELGYEYNNLAVNEILDETECKMEKIDIDEYDFEYIDYPSEKMMENQKKLQSNMYVEDVRCIVFSEKTNEYNYEEEKEKFEGFRIVYSILGYEKTRFYQF